MEIWCSSARAVPATTRAATAAEVSPAGPVQPAAWPQADRGSRAPDRRARRYVAAPQAPWANDQPHTHRSTCGAHGPNTPLHDGVPRRRALRSHHSRPPARFPGTRTNGPADVHLCDPASSDTPRQVGRVLRRDARPGHTPRAEPCEYDPDGIEQPSGVAHPRSERGAGQFDAASAINAFLPEERCMIRILRRNHLRQWRRRRQTPLDGTHGRRRTHDPRAVRAQQLRAHVADNLEVPGHVVELFGDILPEALE